MLEHARQYQRRQIPDHYHKGSVSPRRRKRPRQYFMTIKHDTVSHIEWQLGLPITPKEKKTDVKPDAKTPLSKDMQPLLGKPIYKVTSPINRRTKRDFSKIDLTKYDI